MRRSVVIKTLCALVVAAALLLSYPGRATAAATPEQTVESFYHDYMISDERSPRHWVETLVEMQKANLDKDLAAWLLEIAANQPGNDKAWLDFDPFGNSQMGTKKYVVKPAVKKNGQTLVPVAILLNRDVGPPKVRVTVALQQRGGKWIITNFLYPAEAGMKAWDLKTFLKTQLKH